MNLSTMQLIDSFKRVSITLLSQSHNISVNQLLWF
jgi:hypothetical protein